MDYVMKLVTTALEWSYAAGETEVRAETLQAAAELLKLRRDAIRMILGLLRSDRPLAVCHYAGGVFPNRKHSHSLDL